MSSDPQPPPTDPTPEATAFEHVQRAAELALAVRNEHPDDVGAWKAWEALATARTLMYGAYSADEFLYSARAAAEVAIRRALHLIFDVAWRYHHPDPGRGAWDEHYHDLPAVGAWHASANGAFAAIQAAYPPGFWDDFRRLRSGDATALETAIAFLQADAWFFRSGYVKAQLIRFVNRCELSDEQAERLRQVVMHAIQGRDRREFRRYCRLARRISTPGFRADLEDVVRPWDASTPFASLPPERRRAEFDHQFRRHVEWVLAYVRGQPLPDRRTNLRRWRALDRVRTRRKEGRKKARE
jgi:hypothetical protein